GLLAAGAVIGEVRPMLALERAPPLGRPVDLYEPDRLLIAEAESHIDVRLDNLDRSERADVLAPAAGFADELHQLGRARPVGFDQAHVDLADRERVRHGALARLV